MQSGLSQVYKYQKGLFYFGEHRLREQHKPPVPDPWPPNNPNPADAKSMVFIEVVEWFDVDL